MGWLLTAVLSLPLTGSDIEVRMWFSKESYCTFAIEKFTEKPFRERRADGTVREGEITSATCREFGPDEQALVPEHLRWKTKSLFGR